MRVKNQGDKCVQCRIVNNAVLEQGRGSQSRFKGPDGAVTLEKLKSLFKF